MDCKWLWASVLYVTVMICACVSVWVPLWGCLCRQYMKLTAVFRVVVRVSVSEPHTSEQYGKKILCIVRRTYVRSGTCSNYVEVTSGSYFASSCVIC